MKGTDMTNFKNELLKEAYKYYKLSVIEFEDMQEAEMENDEEMVNVYWANCSRHSGKCDGLLLAYKMLTGEHLYKFELRDLVD